MWNHSRRFGLLLGIAVITVAGSLGWAAAQHEDANKKLAEAQLALARQAISELDRLHQSGELSLASPQFALWEHRQVDALRLMGTDKPQTVKALEELLKRQRTRFQAAEQAYKSGQTNHVEVLEAQYAVLEAEILLNRERAR
jgi:outer membrane protein TolC